MALDPPSAVQGEAGNVAAPVQPEALGGSKSQLQLIAIDRIDEDDTFRIRPGGELSSLATDLARLGQLFPVELRARPGDRYQLVCGFRRVAALKLLQRETAWARVHADLSDEDALLMALASGLHSTPASRDDLTALRARLE